MRKLSFLLAALVAGVFAFTASAEILVYDGFASSAYTIGAKGTGTLNSYPKQFDETMIGFAEKTWQMSGTQPKVWGYGLKLPDSFAGANILAQGEWSIGPNGGGDVSQNRNATRELIGEILKKSSGSLYFRLLMHIDKTAVEKTMKAADKIIEGSGSDVNFWGCGFAPETGTAYNLLTGKKGAFGFFFRKNKAGEVAVVFRGKGTDGTVLEHELCAVPADTAGIQDKNTYIAYAQIDINAGEDGRDVIFAGAQNITTYSAMAAGESITTAIGEIDLFSDTVYPKSLVFDGCYQSNGKVFFDEIGVATDISELIDIVYSGGLQLGDSAVTREGDTYTATATVLRSAATDAGAIAFDGEEGILHSIGAVAQDASFEASFSMPTPADNKTYNLGAYAIGASGGNTNYCATAYNGVLSLTKVKDANEYGLVPGEVTVSRENADPYPLTINFSFASETSGAEEGKTWEVPAPVTIPAGEASTTIYLKPKIDATILEDVKVTLQVTEGNYLPVEDTVELTIVNLSAPEGYNTWVASADGKASDPANWTGGVPQAGDAVLFDGNFSSANCEWDAGENALSTSIESLTISPEYTGTLTVLTTFPEAADSSFRTFTIVGDATINGGVVTHGKHTSEHRRDYYRLKISVGGKLVVGSDAKISADAKGTYLSVGKVNTSSYIASTYGGSYNGYQAWGSLVEPTNVGISGHEFTDGAIGGGAIWIEAAGTMVVNGSISANGISGKIGSDTYAGSGGAVYLKTTGLSGSGAISADCMMTDRSSNTRSAAGGRVSILLTESELNDFPPEKITAYAANPSYTDVGGCGTVLVRSPLKPNGVLYLADRSTRYNSAYGYHPSLKQMTDIPVDATWRLDGIVFGYGAILRVPTSSTLELPNGLASISGGASDSCSGLVIDGGTLVIPDGDQTISGGWVFQPNEEFTIKGNLSLTNGGKVGTLFIWTESTNVLCRCRLNVAGDMIVDASSSIYAVRGGYVKTDKNTPANGAISVHGGQCGFQTGNQSYGSVFNPDEAGGFGAGVAYHPGSGVVILKVDGTLTLNGSATADSKWFSGDNRPGAAGTINITAGRLEGSGSVSASGAERSYYYSDPAKCGDSAGGRVAIRLTDADATFDDSWLGRINAKGKTYTGKKDNAEATAANSSSAGTIYLQAGNEDEGAGTIYVRNDNNTANNVAYTPIPSTRFGGENDDYHKAKMVIEGASIVKLFASLKMANLTMAANTKLDLNEKILTVKSAEFGDVKVKAGTYTASDYPEFLTGDGSLVVNGSGVVIIIQ